MTGNPIDELPYTIETVYYQHGQGFTFDPQLQRTYMPKKAAGIAADFDPNALGILHLSEHSDGTRIGLDGQHRVRASELVGYDGFQAKVYRNLTVEQEAKLFRQLNNTSKVHTLDLYRIALQEKRGPETKLQAIVLERGLTTLAGHQNSFTAVQTGLRILAHRNGDEHLRWAFRVAIDSWGASPDSLNGQIIEALSMVRGRFPGIDTENMIKKLAQRAGKAPGLLGDAKTLQRSYGGSVKTNICEVLMSTYNSGLRKYKLPDWRTSEAMTKAEADRVVEAMTEVEQAPPQEPMIRSGSPAKPGAWFPRPQSPKFSGRA